MINSMSRRGILRGLAAAPVAAPAMAEQVKMGMLGRLGAGGLAGAGLNGGETQLTGGVGPVKLYDFASWLKKGGERELRQSTKHVDGFDPDIIERRLPLATKVRMQRQRNYERRLQERKDWFAERLSLNGVVEMWM